MRAARSFCALALLLWGLISAPAAESIRFAVFDVLIDPHGETLAAYQITLDAPESEVKLVSIEGGEHPAFKDAPYHDPKAIQKSKVILAAFSTAPTEALPTRPVRVASLHVQVTGNATPQFRVEVQKTGNANAEMIRAQVVVRERISTD